MLHERIATPRRVADTREAIALLQPSFAGLAFEELRILYLDCRLVPIRLALERGTDPHGIDLPLRGIVADALALDAHAIILAHNHPAGDPAPSAADKAVTRRLADVVEPLGIRILDHLVFGDGRAASFRALGLL